MRDPEERPAVEQYVAQRAAAERGRAGDEADADGVEALARRFDQPRQREGEGPRHLDDDQDVGQR